MNKMMNNHEKAESYRDPPVTQLGLSFVPTVAQKSVSQRY